MIQLVDLQYKSLKLKKGRRTKSLLGNLFCYCML